VVLVLQQRCERFSRSWPRDKERFAAGRHGRTPGFKRASNDGDTSPVSRSGPENPGISRAQSHGCRRTRLAARLMTRVGDSIHALVITAALSLSTNCNSDAVAARKRRLDSDVGFGQNRKGFTRTFDEGGPARLPTDRGFLAKPGPPCRLETLDQRKCGRIERRGFIGQPGPLPQDTLSSPKKWKPRKPSLITTIFRRRFPAVNEQLRGVSRKKTTFFLRW
jgi:hypothetical protein